MGNGNQCLQVMTQAELRTPVGLFGARVGLTQSEALHGHMIKLFLHLLR